jgi:hypothetical protein
VKADFMVLLKKNKKNLMQNGGEIQDGRQRIKCSRYVKTAPKNFKKYHRQLVFKKIQNGRTIHYIFCF